MSEALKILHLEDDPRDAEMVRDLLEASGVACDLTRVHTRDEFLAALDRGALDVILANYSLPSFDGMSALRIAMERSPDVPFIFVSGALGEEVAIEALKLGAMDYVLKERMSTVVGAVRNALREAEHRVERKRAEDQLRASEERFRALVQFSFDVYWETDAEHRFTRQEFSDRLADAPAREAQIGKTPWDIPYVEPDEEGWSKYRATVEAHLPYRDFELARPTAGGGVRYISASGLPVFDENGRFLGYRGVGRHITERRLAEAEHRAHVWFLESMDRINRALQGTLDVEKMMSDVLDAVLEIYACDRAWLVYPCDPAAATWRVVMEHTRPEFPGAFALGSDLPVDEDVAAVFATALAAPGAVIFGSGHPLALPPDVADRLHIQSQIAIAIDAKTDKPYLFGLHQCSRPRDWTAPERRLLQEIGRRLGDGISTLSMLRNLRDSERKLEAAHKIAQLGWWERDLTTSRVIVSKEIQSIFGVGIEQADQFGQLIHPEDRAGKDAAVAAAARGGPRYDVEYRVVRPDGGVRVVHSQGDIIRDESGRAVRQFGVLQDVTELRRVEDELIASEQRYRALFDKANDAFFVLDDDLKVVDVNPQAYRSLGYTREELIGMRLADFDAGQDEGTDGRLVGGDRIEQSVMLETRHRRKDGTVFPVEVRTGTFRQGERLFCLAVARDISERNATLDARVAERTRIARELHDTLLQSFHGLLLRFQIARALLPANPVKAAEALDRAIDQAAHAITEGRDAVQGLRDTTTESIDLPAAIRDIAAHAADGQSTAVRIHVQGAPRELHPIVRDESFRIADEALRNSLRHARARTIEIELHYDPREFRLRVRDDGSGIDPAILQAGYREGHFGLPGMRERAQVMGGNLTVSSKPGAGTQVEIVVPASRGYLATLPSR